MNIDYINAARSLKQCTLGYRKEDVEQVIALGGIENWIDEQAFLPASSWRELYKESAAADTWNGVYAYVSSWDALNMEGKDLLRQRIAYVLSQLFVVSTNDLALTPHSRREYMCNYYDGLLTNGLGNFADVIRFVSTSPIMGEYLTFVDNVSNESTAPDENYARELLQLFTLGTTQLAWDGSVKYDENGNERPAYTQEDIEELARVFTGWEWHDRTTPIKYSAPMVPTGEHDMGSKVILGKTFPAGQTAEQDLEMLIDRLMSREQLYTFVAKFFITKMVTSNPSPHYIRRVRNAFSESRGDLLVLAKAILTDKDALRTDDKCVKVRDPIIVFTHAMKAFGLRRTNENKVWPAIAAYSRLMPMGAPSVFYHYKPDDKPNNELFKNLVAPEFNVYQWHNLYEHGSLFGSYMRLQSEEREQYIDPILFELYNNFDDEGVVNYLNENLFDFQMSDYAKQSYFDFLSQCTRRHEGRTQDIKALIMNSLISPEFTIQR
ncbi:DUF1800 family protein (plasmid) [Photobacterium sp. DA100]|uniref:DUF1800 family protein n=1 Tax=Photobacterium sp. DA100 TaxID=3027472 RepID=UPI0024787F90|nr:DUF1800 family protein [Photobacterium sp. DA100]WEM45358.1 DUF1800 family protein [Photobacterium sp. DA100]